MTDEPRKSWMRVVAPLAAEALDCVFFRDFDIQVEFTRAPDGRVDGLVRHQVGRQYRAERV